MKKENSAYGCLPKFFKVYLPDDSGDDLRIPISFNSCLPKPSPKKVTVRNINGNVWKLVLRKCASGGTEKYILVNGWKRIVKDEDLKGGEFLTFEFDGSGLFNFCIYGRSTCKRIGRSLVHIEGESLGKSSDDVIVLDDDDEEDDNDDDDEDDDADDEDEEDEEEDDDDEDEEEDDDFDEDDEDSDDEDKSSEDIITHDDDDDDDDFNDIDNYVDEDKSKEDIIVIDDDDDDQDDDNTRRRGVETEREERGSYGVSKKTDSENEGQYLCNDMNPFFTVKQNLQRKNDAVIKGQGLRFPKFIDPEMNGLVCEIKVHDHVIRA